GSGSVFEVQVPPPALGPDVGDGFGEDLTDETDEADEADEDLTGEDLTGEALTGEADELDELIDLGDDELDDFGGIPDGPPAEAAHARRTMIGRSAEEVDHAPPRGRYAPTPAPDSGTVGLPLRWIAPAAALALASAVVVSRALRRRR
ncbi:hypothetical protein ACWF94_31420, partial [Streptomyces sp. NPDC055078]